MYREFFEKLENLVTYNGIDRMSIDDMSKRFQYKMKVSLPDDYLVLLEETNGCSFNGKKIFGIYDDLFLKEHPRMKSLDVFNFNKTYIEMTDITDYVMIGKSSLEYVVFDLIKSKYCVLTNGTMESLGEYNSLYDLLINYFNDDF